MSSWVFLGALLLLCAILGVLQYRWTGEVSLAARDRMRFALQTSLFRVSQDFNSEINAAVRGLMPADTPADPAAVERDILAKLDQWRNARILRRVAVAWPVDGALKLRMLDVAGGAFAPAEWPGEWKEIRDHIASRLEPGSPPVPPYMGATLVFEFPLMPAAPPGMPRHEVAWIVLELNPAYLQGAVLPEILQRDLEAGSVIDYQVEVITRAGGTPIYRSDPAAGSIAATADASIGLLDLRFPREMGGFGRGRGGGARGRGAPGEPGPEFGRWQLYARHKAGSLEAAVSQLRVRNLAVTGGVLLLLIATAGALVRYTRRAQALAELQMDFVAGVSHELRTPLTVIQTAAYNLRGKLAQNPAQVERYGELIQKESARLKELVEQVLRYGGAVTGNIIRQPEPVDVEAIIDDTLAAGKAEIESAYGNVEKSVEPALPMIMADPLALKHAIGNLVSNAAKYGLRDDRWIGISASRGGSDTVEIRVADHGPGIPPEEQPQIFDPFFRGERAVKDQVHGTGLGLNLAKKIVEAHGGSIVVKSELARGTEFIVRLPALPNGGAA